MIDTGCARLRLPGFALLLAFGCLRGFCQTVPAQPVSVPASAELPESLSPITTLHVYVNLEQIPTLVLTPSHQRLKLPIEESRFRVSLDSGPKFKPTHVRKEGDDPISLSVLIDGTKPKNELLAGLEQAVAGLVARPADPGANEPGGEGFLRQRDHVSVYLMDCGLMRTANDLPVSGAILKLAVGSALDRLRERSEQRAKERAACPAGPGLWDAMRFISLRLTESPGRRVLLVLTDGTDRGSKVAWKTAMKIAQIGGVTVVGLLRENDVAAPTGPSGLSRGIGWRPGSAVGPPGMEDHFDEICESSGGVELGATEKTLPRTLHWFIQMLRERYVIEFPRDDNLVAGEHSIEVSILKGDQYIRTTGITVPVADKKVLNDPATLHGDSVSAPPVGTRKPLGPG